MNQLALVDADGRHERIHLQPRLRQRAGLVEQNRVDGRERLDRVQLLREDAAARHADRGDRVRDACEQDQPFGNERHDGRNRCRHRVVQRRVPPVERPPERYAERHEHGDQDQEQPVDRPLERRARMPELARLSGNAGRVALLPDRGHVVGAGALDRERAGADLVAGAADDRRRLACEDRLVEREAVAASEDPVRDDLVARLE